MYDILGFSIGFDHNTVCTKITTVDSLDKAVKAASEAVHGRFDHVWIRDSEKTLPLAHAHKDNPNIIRFNGSVTVKEEQLRQIAVYNQDSELIANLPVYSGEIPSIYNYCGCWPREVREAIKSFARGDSNLTRQVGFTFTWGWKE